MRITTKPGKELRGLRLIDSAYYELGSLGVGRASGPSATLASALEQPIAPIWRVSLKMVAAGTDTNFADLGGR